MRLPGLGPRRTLPRAGWRRSQSACPSFPVPLPCKLTLLPASPLGMGTGHTQAVGGSWQPFLRVEPLLSQSSGSSLACLLLPRDLAASIGILISGQPVFSWPGAEGRITDPVSAPVASVPALGPPGAYGVRAAALSGFGGASSVILEGLGVWKGPLLSL